MTARSHRAACWVRDCARAPAWRPNPTGLSPCVPRLAGIILIMIIIIIVIIIVIMTIIIRPCFLLITYYYYYYYY